MKRAAHLLIVAFASVVSASACSCGQLPACAKLGVGAVIFEGTVLQEAHPNSVEWKHTRPVVFRVSRIFKGIPFGTPTVAVDSFASSSCEAPFEKGKQYLVYAGLRNDGSIFTGLCHGSMLISDARADLEFLDRWQAHKTATTILGTVWPSSWQLEPETTANRLQKMMRGTRIQAIHSDGTKYEVQLGESSKFELSPVKEGDYRISAEKEKFRAEFNDQKVTVPADGCAVAYFSLEIDGQISGRLRESGGINPIPIELELTRIVSGEITPESKKVRSNLDGGFQFVGVPPGSYRLSINAQDEPTAKSPYERIFFPGATNESGAQVIKVGEAEHLQLKTLTISKRMKPRRIFVQVTWPDGKPAPLAHAWSAPETYIPWQHLLTDKNGQITFEALDRLAYIVGSATASNYEITERRRYSAQWVRIPPGADTKIVLRLAPPKN